MIADTAPVQDYGANGYYREQVREGNLAVVSVADFVQPQDSSYSAELHEQARRKGVRPIASADELRADGCDLMKNSMSSWPTWRPFRHEHMA